MIDRGFLQFSLEHRQHARRGFRRQEHPRPVFQVQRLPVPGEGPPEVLHGRSLHSGSARVEA